MNNLMQINSTTWSAGKNSLKTYFYQMTRRNDKVISYISMNKIEFIIQTFPTNYSLLNSIRHLVKKQY